MVSKPSFFMSTKEAADCLGVTVPHLNGRSSIVCTFHLMISGERTSRLWPREYINAFAVYTRHKNHCSISTTAKAFATLPEVSQLLEGIQQAFARRLEAREVFTGAQAAEVFCVPQSTIASWRTRNILVPAKGQELPRAPQGRPVEYVFLRAELQRLSKWHLPKL